MLESYQLVMRSYAESLSSNLYQWSSFYIVYTPLQTALLGTSGLFGQRKSEDSLSSEQLAFLWLIQIFYLVGP